MKLPGGKPLATGLWTSVSGAAAREQWVDTTANNLANAGTDGFKKDLPAFKEYLSHAESGQQNPNIPHGPIKDKDLYPLEGRDQAFVVTQGTYTNFKQGALRVTQAPLDLALDGPGLIEVATPAGVRYTRHGNFKMAVDGKLVTTEGYPVLAAGAGGLAATEPNATTGAANTNALEDPAIAGRMINLKDKGPVSVTESGEIYAGQDLVGKLSVVEFQDSKKLRKQGQVLFSNPDPTNAVAPTRTRVKQGMLETSNVNPVEEMANLIRANRMFEHDMKVMKTYNDLLGREANDIGKL